MLKVLISIEEGNILGLRLKGHAEYAEVGKDIVCASASILAYTMAQLVKEAEHRGYLKAPAKIRLEKGDTLVACEPKKEAMNAVQDAFFFAKTGYELLAHNYPQYVEVITDGEAE